MDGEAITHAIRFVLHLWGNGMVLAALFFWRIGPFALAGAGFAAFVWQGRPPRWHEAKVDRGAETEPSFSFR